MEGFYRNLASKVKNSYYNVEVFSTYVFFSFLFLVKIEMTVTVPNTVPSDL